jgi:chromosome segregation ATPase
MTKSLPPFSQHLASLERRLEAGRTDQQNLTVQVQKIDAGSRATLALARQQTDVLTSHVQQSMLQEQRKQSAVLQNQVSQLASDRNSDRQRLTQVQEQLAQAHQELEMARMDYTRELDALREQQGMENRELASLSNSLSTRQVSFRVQKNKLAAIIPGVSFQLTKIDVRHQRFDGLIESASANQKVSVQSQGVRSPIVFFPSAHGRAFLLVVTKVDDMGAVGYLLLPAAKTDQRDFVSATGNPLSPALELPGNESRVSEP